MNLLLLAFLSIGLLGSFHRDHIHRMNLLAEFIRFDVLVII